MKVFKFGGASVKDVAGVKNIISIVKEYSGGNGVMVVSAMGKTTNNLERLVDAFFYKKENPNKVLDEIKKYHYDIMDGLFADKTHPAYIEIHNTFVELEWAIEDEPTHSYDCEYDQIVCMGEVIATKIVSAYLTYCGVAVTWLDARDLIKTDETWREGKVDWTKTEENCKAIVQQGKFYITQGFIGGTPDNFTTTLGREGSDYTAAIMAYCLNAESVTIWKDVPGVLNADPKWFDDTKLIPQLSFQDAIELSYYGATVIHPKTIKPLQNKDIPLYVKSFLSPEKPGTKIDQQVSSLPVPCFIFKVNQVLLSVSAKDFSFIVEENLSDIFKIFYQHGVKINTMQNSAISFSLCVDQNERKLPDLIKELQKNYRVLYNTGLELITIRYYDQATIDRVCIDKEILLEVKSRYTVQLVVRPVKSV